MIPSTLQEADLAMRLKMLLTAVFVSSASAQASQFLSESQLESVANVQLKIILNHHEMNLVVGSIKIKPSNDLWLLAVKPLDDLAAFLGSGISKRIEFYSVGFGATDSAGRRFQGRMIIQVNDVEAMLPPDEIEKAVALAERSDVTSEMTSDAPWLKGESGGRWYQVLIRTGFNDDMGGLEALADPETKLQLKPLR